MKKLKEKKQPKTRLLISSSFMEKKKKKKRHKITVFVCIVENKAEIYIRKWVFVFLYLAGN